MNAIKTLFSAKTILVTIGIALFVVLYFLILNIPTKTEPVFLDAKTDAALEPSMTHKDASVVISWREDACIDCYTPEVVSLNVTTSKNIGVSAGNCVIQESSRHCSVTFLEEEIARGREFYFQIQSRRENGELDVSKVYAIVDGDLHVVERTPRTKAFHWHPFQID